MKINSIFLILISGILIYTGCATIVASGPDHVPVNTNPTGAKIYVDGNLAGQTPAVVAINRKGEGIIRIELAGYEPVVINRDKVLNGWFLGNALLFGGGIIGLGVDLITSNQGKYSDEPVYAQLTPASNKLSKNEVQPLKIPLKPASVGEEKDPFNQ